MIQNGNDMPLRVRTRDGQLIPAKLPSLSDLEVVAQSLFEDQREDTSLYTLLYFLSRATGKTELECAKLFGTKSAPQAALAISSEIQRLLELAVERGS